MDQQLIQAAQNGQLEVVRELLDRGANIHAGGDFALRTAAEHGHLEVVEFLINTGADIHYLDDAALRWAAEKGHLEVVRLLLDKGADIHALDYSSFLLAAKNGHVEVVRLLLNRGANIHASNDYALRKAAQNGHLEVVRLLLDSGADIHEIGGRDEALDLAAERGHLEVVRLLLDRGANIDIISDEPLRRLSPFGHLEVTKLLLERGAKIPNSRIIEDPVINLFITNSFINIPLMTKQEMTQIIRMNPNKDERVAVIQKYLKENPKYWYPVDWLYIVDLSGLVDPSTADIIQYLFDYITKELLPTGVLSKEASDRFELAQGILSSECNVNSYASLQSRALSLLSGITLMKACMLINEFKDMIDLESPCAEYEISDLIDVVTRLIPLLNKRKLCRSIEILK